MDKLKNILQCLNDGQFHSGAELGNLLGLTRAAIWKLIRQIKALHIGIEAKTHKGYRLTESIELLCAHQIKAALKPEYQPYIDTMVIFDTLPSTNTHLLQLASNPQNTLKICLTEMQTGGAW